MAANLVRSTVGTLFSDNFTSLSNWTSADAVLAITSLGTMVASDPGAVDLLQPTAFSPNTAFQDGIREPQLLVDTDNSWWLLVDGGNGTTGWNSFLTRSTDNGSTWSQPVMIDTAYQDGIGGSWAAAATGWLEKRGGTYYYHRIPVQTVATAPNTGLPSSGFYYDIWSLTAPTLSPTGWTFVRRPAFVSGANYGASPLNLLPGSVYYDGSTYHVFLQSQATAGSAFVVAHGSSATSPTGPWTYDATYYFGPSQGILGSVGLENPKVFYNPTIGRYFMLTNNIEAGGTYTNANILLASNSLTGWASVGAADTNWIQNNQAGDSNHAIGVITPMMLASTALPYISSDGYVPCVFDGDPPATIPSSGAAQSNAQGWHMGRSIKSAIMEPSATYVKSTSSASTDRYLRKTLSHTDCIVEFILRFENAIAAPGAGGVVGFTSLSLWLRSDANQQNAYRFAMRNTDTPLIQKFVGGAFSSTLVIGSTVKTDPYYQHRVRCQAIGTTLSIYLDNTIACTVTDASFATGTQIALMWEYSDNTEVRNFNIRTSNTVTVNGCPAGSRVVLRGAGNLPLATATANGSGIASLVNSHYPAHAIDVAGTIYPIGGLVYGGDVYNLASPNTPYFSLTDNPVPAMIRR